MRRILFTIVCACSFLVLLSIATLWARSYWYSDVWSQTDAQDRTRILQSQVGAVHLRQIEGNAAILGMPTIPTWSHNTVAPGTTWSSPYAGLSQKIEWRAAGFAVVSGHNGAMMPVVLSGAINTTTLSVANANNSTTISSLNPTLTNSASVTINDGLVNLNPSAVTVNPTGGITITGSGATVSGLNVGSGRVTMNPAGSITANTITFLNSPQSHLAVVIPYWCPAALAGILPVIFAFKSRRWLRERRRKRLGLCQCCGYDLRASTDRCPECGTGI